MKKPSISSLQGLKVLAFIGVFLAHTTDSVWSGQWGVSLFIVLSGFLLIYNHYEEDMESGAVAAIKFSVSRIKKFYPLHIVMLLIKLLLELYMKSCGLMDFGWKEEAAKVLLNVLLIKVWVPKMQYFFSVNGSAWYLCVLVVLYFAFPYFQRRIKRYKNRKEALAAILTIFIIQFCVAFIFGRFNLGAEKERWFTYVLPPFRLLDFYAGCNLGYLFIKRAENKNISESLMTMLETALVVITIAVIIIYPRIQWHWFRYTVMYTPLSLLTIYLIGLHRGKIAKICANKLFVGGGYLTGWVMLIHESVIRVMRLFLPKELYILPYKVIMIIIELSLSFMVAYGYELYKEKLR